MASPKILHSANHNDWLLSKHTTNDCLPSVKSQYCRETTLPKLLPLWPHEVADRSFNGVARIVAMLARALRSERQRGKAGHWSYDLSRHLALLNALREERAELKRLAAVAKDKTKGTRTLRALFSQRSLSLARSR